MFEEPLNTHIQKEYTNIVKSKFININQIHQGFLVVLNNMFASDRKTRFQLLGIKELMGQKYNIDV
jgi:hypothetical protein